MAFEFIFPDVGEGVQEGTIVKWLVKEGDVVKNDQPIGEVETDKAIVELPSPRAGKILKLNYKPGEVVKVGASLCSIDDGSATAPAAPATTTAAPAVTTPAAKPVESVEKPAEATKSASAPKSTSVPANNESIEVPKEEKKEYMGIVGDLSGAQTVLAESHAESSSSSKTTHAKISPAARRLAKDLGVELASVRATGTDGEVTIADVKSAAKLGGSTATPAVSGTVAASTTPATSTPTAATGAASPTVKKKYDMYGYIDRLPYKGMRKAVGDHMVLSAAHIPRVTHIDEADVTDLMAIREKEKANAEKEGVKLTLLPFLVKAVWAAHQKHPSLNSMLDEAGAEIIIKKYFNCGIAVDTGDGLVVPVIIRAETQSITQIAKNIQELAEKARTKKLTMMDMKGGSFTITNVGSIGGISATAIINYPESAILLVGRTRTLPRYNKKGELVPSQIMPLSLTFDHRITDGAEAARWMNTLKEHLEDPDMFLVE